MSIELVMPSNHLILCHLCLLLPSVFSRVRVFSTELAIHIRWPKTNGVKGYNSVSRHVVYVGGGTSPEGEDTRTEAQRKTLADYVLRFHEKHPSVRIIGHNEITGKACPSFDVQEFLQELGIVQ